MIGIFIGMQNSGKTLSMSYYAYLYYKQNFTIYSNYNLEFPHIKLTKEIILDYTTKRKQFSKSIFCIDEIYLFFDARKFSSKSNMIFSYFVTQSSKNDVHIFGTAQFFNTIEKRIRENATFKCFCSRYIKKNNSYYPLNKNIRFLDKNINDVLYINNSFLMRTIDYINLSDKYYSKTVYIKAKEIFKLFNTKELISISGD